MFSFVYETVLDPFLGSGTTTKVAQELNRNSIGYEINNDYLPIIKEKVGVDNQSLFHKKVTCEIIYQTPEKNRKAKESFGTQVTKNPFLSTTASMIPNTGEFYEEGSVPPLTLSER